MRYGLHLVIMLLFIGNSLPAQADSMSVEVPNEAERREKQLIGWVEPIIIFPEEIRLEAKISPSFATSALHADDVKVFKRGGKRYVRFSLEGRDGELRTLERPIDENLTEEALKAKKVVVKMAFCLGSERVEVDVLLSDRSGFEQEVRIARDTLAGRFIVDPSRTHTLHADCLFDRK